MITVSYQGLRWQGPLPQRVAPVLSPEALGFLARLTRRFRPELERLLLAREERQRAWDRGEAVGFLPETAPVREGDWRVAPLPADLADRRVEITGPPERKMLLNALNSGARVHMSDFEDSLAPTAENLLEGQANLMEAVRGTLRHGEGGKAYELKPDPAVLMVRPRGLHLQERHLEVDGRPVPACLFDAGLYLFHNAQELLSQGKGLYLYLPKLEHHQEARWYDQVLRSMEDELELPPASIRTTMLIETLPAAFQMDEILFEMRDRALGLNLGRWDYIFSFIKTRRMDPAAVLPDRAQVGMTRPFLRAYARRLVQTCHRRGCAAMGGMSAFVPSKADPAATERAIEQTRADKLREVQDGCDGTWVAHPALVPVATEVFDQHMPTPNQIHRIPEGETSPADLLEGVQGTPTDAGLRHNLRVGIRYLEAWLRGQGCVALYGLMEDAATAEISRMQLWQWLHHETPIQGHGVLDRALFHRLIREALAQIRQEVGPVPFERGSFGEAAELFETLVVADCPEAFLTLSAYERLLGLTARPQLGEIA
ncbi:MAG: malate synthase A [Acidobacteria bacterium]|nr:malate synthase A [Acidobacteriota bacterium]